MTIIRTAATVAILAACPLSSAIVSAAPRSDTRVPVTIHVSHAGLDLADAGDRGRLAERIGRAARRACGIGSMRGVATMDANRCYREMLADGEGQLAAIERRSVQLAVR